MIKDEGFIGNLRIGIDPYIKLTKSERMTIEPMFYIHISVLSVMVVPSPRLDEISNDP